MTPSETTQELIPAPQKTETKAVTKFTAEHGKEVGLPSPEAINYMMSVANLLINSSLITGDMGTTPEKIKANALAKMLVGHELQMQPMEALQDIDIVRGKVFVRYPQLINQLILRGFKWKWIERSNERAAMEVTRPGQEPELFEFTIADAKLAGLTGADSQYSKRPRVMLSARVVSEAYRMTGGRSNVYAPEERAEILEEARQIERLASAPEPENPYAPKIKDTPTALSPVLDSAHEAHEARAEGPDASAHAAAGSSASGQQPEGTGSAAAAALPQAGAGEGATAEDTTGGAPETVKSAKPKMDPRVPELLGAVEKLLPPKQKKKIVEEYLRGYFNVTDLKPVMLDPRMPDAAALLLALCGDWRVQLIGDPHAYGVAAAAGWAKLSDFVKDWPEDSRQLAQAMALQYADTGGEGLYDYFAVLDLDSLPHPELDAFLKVVWRIGIGKPATALRECGAIKDTVEGWGLDLKTCEPAEIIARIADLEAPPFEPTVSEEDEPIFDLFERGGSSEIK